MICATSALVTKAISFEHSRDRNRERKQMDIMTVNVIAQKNNQGYFILIGPNSRKVDYNRVSKFMCKKLDKIRNE